jgi:hypothetical protein
MFLAFLYPGFVTTTINSILPHKQTQCIITFYIHCINSHSNNVHNINISTIYTTAVIYITKKSITGQKYWKGQNNRIQNPLYSRRRGTNDTDHNGLNEFNR